MAPLLRYLAGAQATWSDKVGVVPIRRMVYGKRSGHAIVLDSRDIHGAAAGPLQARGERPDGNQVFEIRLRPGVFLIVVLQ